MAAIKLCSGVSTGVGDGSTSTGCGGLGAFNSGGASILLGGAFATCAGVSGRSDAVATKSTTTMPAIAPVNAQSDSFSFHSAGKKERTFAKLASQNAWSLSKVGSMRSNSPGVVNWDTRSTAGASVTISGTTVGVAETIDSGVTDGVSATLDSDSLLSNAGSGITVVVSKTDTGPLFVAGDATLGGISLTGSASSFSTMPSSSPIVPRRTLID